MEFDYEGQTKSHYLADETAERYHAAFAQDRGWRALRIRIIADAERHSVRRLIQRVPHGSVLDIPCGTGKLARVFQELRCSVTSCDISPAMLAIAQRVYADAGHDEVVFQVCDAERISSVVGRRFDVAVCLRLMHRVPVETRVNILGELAQSADHAVVSFGIETVFHKVRRPVRALLFGGGTSALCFASRAEVEREIAQSFDIIASAAVLPLLSQERMYLLRPKRLRESS